MGHYDSAYDSYREEEREKLLREIGEKVDKMQKMHMKTLLMVLNNWESIGETFSLFSKINR